MKQSSHSSRGRAAIEINQDNLEDLLIYDDLLLDYFNAFLKLPAFPQALRYHRLTGTLEVVKDEEPLVNSDVPPYGATDEERERIMDWAKEYRLPLFLKTEIFRELKLCKLLLRPLNDSESCHSRGTNVHGYSRHSSSFASSLSNNSRSREINENDDEDDDDDDEDDDDYDDEDDEDYDEEDEEDQEYDMKTYDIDYEDGSQNTKDEDGDQVPYDNFARPGSRAISLPAKLGLSKGEAASHLMKDNVAGKKKRKSLASREVTFANKDNTEIQNSSDASKSSLSTKKQRKISVQFNSKKDQVYRIYSAPLNYSDYLRLPVYSEFDYAYGGDAYGDGSGGFTGGQPLINFPGHPGFGKDVDYRLNPNEMEELEGRQEISFQRMKELILGNRLGMHEFFKFLSETMGISLVEFWLDCEYYKDNIYCRGNKENNDLRNKLFRDLQDKYKLRLTTEAKRQIREAAGDPEQANSLFLRAQYDVLRRLRSYWVPRFIIHKEREVRSHTMEDLQNDWLKTRRLNKSNVAPTPSLFPSLSLGNSGPIQPEDVMREAKMSAYEKSLQARVQKENIKPALPPPIPKGLRLTSAGNLDYRPTTTPKTPNTLLMNRLWAALAVDKMAGGPLQAYLERESEPICLNRLQYFQEVEEYASIDDKSADRLLRLGHAWAICNKYLMDGARSHIGIDRKESEQVVNILKKSRNAVSSSYFAKCQEYCVTRLEQSWLQYLKEDVRSYMQSSINHRDSTSPPHSLEEIEVLIEGGKIVVRRTFPRQLSCDTTDANQRRRSWDLLSPEEKQHRRRIALEKRRETERERRKAVRAAKRRLKEHEMLSKHNAKSGLIRLSKEPTAMSGSPTLPLSRKGGKSTSPDKLLDGQEEGDKDKKSLPPPKKSALPELKESLGNRIFMALFRRYLVEHVSKDMGNQLQLYQDVQTILAAMNKSKPGRLENLATTLYKNYLDKQPKRKVDLPEKLLNRAQTEKDHPSVVTIKDIHSYLHPEMCKHFAAFWELHAKELGIDVEELKQMTEREIAVKSEVIYNATLSDKTKKTKKVTGKAVPTKEDKQDFLNALDKSIFGPLTLQMLYFYKYLVKYKEEDNAPNIDKELFFYVEAQKYKEMCQGRVEDECLKRKIQCIVNTFIESAYPPACQINVSNDVSQRLVRQMQRCITGRDKDLPLNIFEEAQFACFKNLLPYWAGFLRQWQAPPDGLFRPVTKYQQMLERRMQRFNDPDMPPTTYGLPDLPKQNPATAMTFSIVEGVKWREEDHGKFNREGNQSYPMGLESHGTGVS